MRNATLLLLVLLAPARLAAIATLSVADGSGAPGDDVEISIDLSGGGGSAATLQLDLLFLTDALGIDPAADCRLDPRLQATHVLVATDPFLAAPPGERRIRVAVLDLTFPIDAFADGPAVTCTFHLPPIVAITSVPLRPERFEVGDSNGDPLPSTVVGGLVTVQPLKPDRPQRQCIVALNRTAFNAGAVQKRQARLCLDGIAKGEGGSLETCLESDPGNRLAKATARMFDADAERCTRLPQFGVPEALQAPIALIRTGAESLALFEDVLGGPPEAALADCRTDQVGCRCQSAVLGGVAKLSAKQMRVFLRCVKAALGAGASDPAALASCLDDPANPKSIAADRSGALARSQSRLSGVIRSRCASVTTAQPFPGSCAGLAGDDLGRCLSERVRCRSCRTVAGVTHLAVDCDGFDDAQPNASCG